MAETTILIVEDEPSIAEVVSLYLRRASYSVLVAQDGLIAQDLLKRGLPDLVILDIMLPKLDGFELVRWLRDQNDVPVIFLTSRRNETDRIAGLEMGADDYVVKPFSPQELVSRVRAVLRRVRSGSQPSSEQFLEYVDLTIDPKSRLVSVQGQAVSLTAKEFDLLWILARNPRQVFTRYQLLEKVWGLSDYIDPSTVTVHVRRLREKIEMDPSNPSRILTVWGVGYKFEP